ncbi:MAG: hypothetical protein ACFFG0_07700 [Candidatus Thorarchaeota archaeon]
MLHIKNAVVGNAIWDYNRGIFEVRVMGKIQIDFWHIAWDFYTGKKCS